MEELKEIPKNGNGATIAADFDEIPNNIDRSGVITKRGQRLDPSPLDYIRATQRFSQRDWVIYVLWVGIMHGLWITITGFLLAGLTRGAEYPPFVWLIPIGIFIFSTSITFDNIAHTVIYKAWITDSEYMVHNFSTASGVATVFALLAGYEFPDLMRVPIYVFAALSVIYSLIDEAMHWERYSRGGSGWVEVTCHFGILVGHTLMVLAWIFWFEAGYPGFGEALTFWGA
ncbi:MAG: hypothetical protein ACXAE3_06790 [Candidatus Kariarchaeaceae archaeon]|jgi:hypothetical protein